MRVIRRGAWLVVVAMVGGWSGSVMAANPSKAQVCEAFKLQAAGTKANCLARAQANEVVDGKRRVPVEVLVPVSARRPTSDVREGP